MKATTPLSSRGKGNRVEIGPQEACHIASWANNIKERRSAENGLLLAPDVHKLFESGLISFADDRTLLSKLSRERLTRFGLNEGDRLSRPLTKRQKVWMKEHRAQYGFE